MRYPDEVVEEVRTRNDIVPVISQYVPLKKRGSNYFGCCPFHSEKTPSFSVSPSKQMYYCFGCGAGGNVITFLMQYENYTFQEALKVLADRAGMTLPEGEITEEERERNRLLDQLRKVNKEAALYYYHQLRSRSGQRAWKYFTDRGLAEETIVHFGLGYAPSSRDALYRFLRGKGYEDEVISQSGLVNVTERGARDRFWNRVIFPIMDANSRVIGFGGRVMGSGEPKYLNSPETALFKKGRSVYGLNRAKLSKTPYFLLCEGYMDVITLHQAGFDCAVASLGTALTEGHASLIKRYVKEVILTYDADEAGVKAALHAIPILREAGFSVRVLDLHPWNDPDEFLAHEGKENFQERVDGAVNAFLYECDVLYRQCDGTDPEQKTAFHREVAQKLTEFSDELERRNYLDAVCERYRIPKDGLAEMVRQISQTVGTGEIPAAVRGKTHARTGEKEEGLLDAERLVLGWALSEEGKPERLRRYLNPGDFSHPFCRSLAERLWRDWEAGRNPNPAAWVDEFPDDGENGRELAAICSMGFPEGRSGEENEKILAESVRRIRRASLDAAVRAERDPQKLQDMIRQKAKIETEPISLL